MKRKYYGIYSRIVEYIYIKVLYKGKIYIQKKKRYRGKRYTKIIEKSIYNNHIEIL
jgi:hypothetical protein